MTRSMVPTFEASEPATASSSTSLTARIRITLSVMHAWRSSAGARQRDDRDAGLFGGELPSEDFSNERLGQLGAEHDLHGDFVWREVRAAVVHQLLRGGLGARPKYDERLHHLA